MSFDVNLGDDDDLEVIKEDEVKMPSCKDYIMHFLTVFWKVLFAFVPPTGKSTFSVPFRNFAFIHFDRTSQRFF